MTTNPFRPTVLVHFDDVCLADCGNGAQHHGDFCLTEPVDALLHITDNTDGGVPRAKRPGRFTAVERPMAP